MLKKATNGQVYFSEIGNVIVRLFSTFIILLIISSVVARALPWIIKVEIVICVVLIFL